MTEENDNTPSPDDPTLDPPEISPTSFSDSDSDLLLGTKIGSCTIKRVIGSGGMGTVYEAIQEEPRRSVALKIMKRGIASRSALRRFRLESQILARLQHPNIAQIYEAGTHDDDRGGVPYFVMEYISSAKTLTEYATDKGLGTRERLALFSKVCDAVQHGHLKGIIHRDLKPSNILVNANGQPKIIDFGVARSTDSDMAVTTLQTDVGQLIGTLQYMSPEQCEADPSDIDARSDVYALGVTLYELLAGRPPYNVRKVAIHEAIRILLEEEPTSLSSFGKHLRGDIETISRKSLEKNRDHRYQSVIALNEDIQRYLDGEQISARSIGKTIGWLKRGTHLNRKELGLPMPSLKIVLFLLAFCALVFGTLYRLAQVSGASLSGLIVCSCPLVGLTVIYFLIYLLSSKSSDHFSRLGSGAAKYSTVLKLLLFTVLYCSLVYLFLWSIPKATLLDGVPYKQAHWYWRIFRNASNTSFNTLSYVVFSGPYFTIITIWLIYTLKMSTKKLTALLICILALLLFSLTLFIPSNSAEKAGLAHPYYGEDVVVFGDGYRAYLITDDLINLPDEPDHRTTLQAETNVVGNCSAVKFELLDWNGEHVAEPVTTSLKQLGSSKSPRGECFVYIEFWDLNQLYQNPRVMAVRAGEVTEQLHFTIRMTVEYEGGQATILKEVEAVFPKIYAEIDVTHNLGEVIEANVSFAEFLMSGHTVDHFDWEGIGDLVSTPWKFALDHSQDLRVTVSLRGRGISPTQIRSNLIKTGPSYVRHGGSIRAKIGDTAVYGDNLHPRIIMTKQSDFPLDIFSPVGHPEHWSELKSGNYIFEFIGTNNSAKYEHESKTTDSFYAIVEDEIDALFRQVFTAIGHPMSEELWGTSLHGVDWHYEPTRTSDCGLATGVLDDEKYQPGEIADLSDGLGYLMKVHNEDPTRIAVLEESINRLTLLNYAKGLYDEGDLDGLQILLDSLNSEDSMSQSAEIIRKREEERNAE